MNSVEKIASKADEKLIHNTTMTKISHDVIGLPDRPHRPVDQLAGAPAAFSPSCDQAPQPCAEVGAREDGVHRRSDPEHGSDRGGLAHPTASAEAVG